MSLVLAGTMQVSFLHGQGDDDFGLRLKKDSISCNASDE